MFAPIFEGCKCGETWHVAIHEEIDTERDEIYEIPYCTICNSSNISPKLADNGIQVMHALTSEEIDTELDYVRDEEDDELPF